FDRVEVSKLGRDRLLVRRVERAEVLGSATRAEDRDECDETGQHTKVMQFEPIESGTNLIHKSRTPRNSGQLRRARRQWLAGDGVATRARDTRRGASL